MRTSNRNNRKALTGAVGAAALMAAACCAADIENAAASGSPDQVRFVVGWSQAKDPAAAAAEAVASAKKALNAQVKGAVYFQSYLKAEDIAKVADAMASALAPCAEVIGVTAEPLVNGGYLRNDALAVLLIGGDKAQVKAVKVALNNDRKKTGMEIGNALKEVKDLRIVLALSEPNLSFEAGVDVENFLHGIKESLGVGVMLWGGNGKPSGDNKPMEAHEFFGKERLSRHVVALGIGGPIGLVSAHTTEYLPVGNPVTVTRTDANDPKIVLEFDNKPAAHVYREIRGMKADQPLAKAEPANMTAVLLPGNHLYTRGVLEENKETGGLGFITSIPVGTKIQILKGGDSVDRIYDSAAEGIRETTGAVPKGAVPLIALASDCCARGFQLMKFTDNKGDEVLKAIKPAMGGHAIPVFGFYAYGELGPLSGEYKGLPYQYMQQTFTLVLLHSLETK